MSGEKVIYKAELISLAEVAKLPRSYMMHNIKEQPVIKAAKLGGIKAIEILKSKPGGTAVITELRKRGKLKDLKPTLGNTIGYSTPTAGDPWYARNAEIWGPNVSAVMFCCSDGPNGVWHSSFNMPVEDDLLVVIHVLGGDGTVNASLDGLALGTFPFCGDDWIIVLVRDLAAGFHTFQISQEDSYFHWLSTEYIRL